MLKLLKKQQNGFLLVEELKSKHNELYNELYKEDKTILSNCFMNDIQEELLLKANYIIVRKHFKDEKFLNYHDNEIKNLIKNELDFGALEMEFKLYQKKLSFLPENESMTYEEIISFEADEDEMIYTKDFNTMMNVLKVAKNLYLWGNAGNGKTTFAYNMAEKLGLKLFNINSIKNEYSVKGFFDMDGKYNLSLYEKWYKDGGVLLLDEADSYSSNGMLYLNNGIEVNSKSLTLENGDVIYKNSNCYVIACANTDGTGKNVDYIGRNAIDKAFMSRFVRKEYKEYSYIHKQIIADKDLFNRIKKFLDKNGIAITTRLMVKFKQLLQVFKLPEIEQMIENKEIEL